VERARASVEAGSSKMRKWRDDDLWALK